MTGPNEEELERRIRVLEEKVQALLESERDTLDELYRVRDTHQRHEKDYREFLVKLNSYLERHEDKHVEINDHLFAAFYKVFPEYEKVMDEAEQILAAPNKGGSLAGTSVEASLPPADYTHDKWCLCPACNARDAKEARNKAERSLDETGHDRWCRCEQCKARIDNEILEEQARKPKQPSSFFTGKPPEEKRVGAPDWNPFGTSSPPRDDSGLPHIPEKRQGRHELDCVCERCVRWRGMGPRETKS